jgi:hypothetical protein
VATRQDRKPNHVTVEKPRAVWEQYSSGLVTDECREFEIKHRLRQLAHLCGDSVDDWQGCRHRVDGIKELETRWQVAPLQLAEGAAFDRAQRKLL